MKNKLHKIEENETSWSVRKIRYDLKIPINLCFLVLIIK